MTKWSKSLQFKATICAKKKKEDIILFGRATATGYKDVVNHKVSLTNRPVRGNNHLQGTALSQRVCIYEYTL